MPVIEYAVVERNFTPTVSGVAAWVEDAGVRVEAKMLTAAPVVKLDVNGVEGSPSVSAVLTATRYSVPGVSRADGVNVPLVLFVVSVPATAVPVGSVTRIVVLAGLTDLLNVARTVVVFDTPVAPLDGVIVETVGAFSVVNVQTTGAIGVPSGLAAATVAAYRVLAARSPDGVKVTDVLVVVSVPVIPVPVELCSVSVDFVGSTALVKLTVTAVFAATPVAPEAGDLLAITGAGEIVLKVHVYGAIAVPLVLDAVTVAV